MSDKTFFAVGTTSVRSPDGNVLQIRVASATGEGPPMNQLFMEEGDKLSGALQTWATWAPVQKEPRKAARNVMGWLRQQSYALIGSFIELEQTACFDGRFYTHERGKRGLDVSSNPFQKGLLALFAHTSSDAPKPNYDSKGVQMRELMAKQLSHHGALDHRQRELMGKQLWYAFRHFVPPVLLEGFLRQCTNRGLKAAASTKGVVEPGFEEWIIENLVANPDGLDIRNEEYPLSLRRKLEARLDQEERRSEAARASRSDWDDDDDEDD